MKQKITLLLLLTMLVTAIAGCGKKAETAAETETTTEAVDTSADEIVSFTTTGLPAREFKVTDYVSAGNYKGVAVEVPAFVPITDEEVEEYVDYIVGLYAEQVEVTDRAAKTGDIVHVLSVGKTMDGEEFDNSGETGYDVEIGGAGFIEGYAESLDGAKIGDVVEVNLTFPENYTAIELAGQDAIFTLTVQSIKEMILPELNDELVLKIDAEKGTDYITVDGLRTTINTELKDYAQSNYDQQREAYIQQTVLSIIIEEATFQELPEELITYHKDRRTYYYSEQAASSGMDLDSFILSNTGKSLDDLVKESAKQDLLFRLIGELENITISDEVMNEKVEEQMAMYGLTTKEEFLGNSDIEEYRDYLLSMEVIQFLVDNAAVTETTAE